jgi:hypothetical protein
LIHDRKQPYLLVEDYWVDMERAKVKRTTRNKVRLSQLNSHGSDVQVYAYRDSRSLNLVMSAPNATMLGGSNSSPQIMGCGIQMITLPMTSRSGVATSFSVGVPDVNADPMTVEDFRSYAPVPLKSALRVSISLSKMSRDEEPVISVSFGDAPAVIRSALQQSSIRWGALLGEERAAERAASGCRTRRWPGGSARPP